jgi:hypothetical protein
MFFFLRNHLISKWQFIKCFRIWLDHFGVRKRILGDVLFWVRKKFRTKFPKMQKLYIGTYIDVLINDSTYVLSTLLKSTDFSHSERTRKTLCGFPGKKPTKFYDKKSVCWFFGQNKMPFFFPQVSFAETDNLRCPENWTTLFLLRLGRSSNFFEQGRCYDHNFLRFYANFRQKNSQIF